MDIPDIVVSQAPLAVLFAIFAVVLIGILIRTIEKTNEKFTEALKEQRQEFSKTVELISEKFGGDIMNKLNEIDDKLDTPRRRRCF